MTNFNEDMHKFMINVLCSKIDRKNTSKDDYLCCVSTDVKNQSIRIPQN